MNGVGTREVVLIVDLGVLEVVLQIVVGVLRAALCRNSVLRLLLFLCCSFAALCFFFVQLFCFFLLLRWFFMFCCRVPFSVSLVVYGASPVSS
jgi:hypothetical protein